MLRAAHNDVRLDTQGQQLFGRVLRGFGFELIGTGDGHDEGDVDVHHVLPSHLRAHLSDGLQKGLGLDIAHGAPDLSDDHIHIAPAAHPVDALLDLIRDMRDNLDRTAQIAPLPLPVEDGPVYLAGGDGGVHRQIFIGKSLIVSQVEIGLGPVVGDEYFAVLVGVHRARVHVEIGVKLLKGHFEPSLFEEPPQRRRRDPLTQPGYHAAGDKNVLDRHRSFLPFRMGRLCPGTPLSPAFSLQKNPIYSTPESGAASSQKSTFYGVISIHCRSPFSSCLG